MAADQHAVEDEVDVAGAWLSVLPSIIDAAERDFDIADMHTKHHAGNMRPPFATIEAAKRRGELMPDRDPDAMVGALVGPLSYRR